MKFKMSLKYVDYFAIKNKKKIKEIYFNSFPKDERFPFWLLKCCAKEENVLFNAIADDNKLIGMKYIIKCRNSVYLMYLAVDKNQRGNGYGSRILADLIKKYESVVLSIERPDKNTSTEKIRRKEFYLRNGFYETNKFIEDNGVQYEILCSNKEFIITKETLEERYTKMTSSPIIKWFISKIFNVYNISFIK